MKNDLELFRFVREHLDRGENVVLLVVAESSGSSPGRAGYKMAVASDGELFGSIGGGVMEVNLVEQSKKLLSEPPVTEGDSISFAKKQIHRKNVEHSSGMICSGVQTVIFKLLTKDQYRVVGEVVDALSFGRRDQLRISSREFGMRPSEVEKPNFYFEQLGNLDFAYEERIGLKNELYVIGGGHCALALSELMSKLDFRISIFDDRPELNTIEKNRFANEIMIIESYDGIAGYIPAGDDAYVVVMTLGYASDKVVIKQLCERDFKYFGVLGSKAKMATLMKELKDEGVPSERLALIRTPIGLPINSRTPEEIAVSIAAEIISVRNSE
ncbi:MAG TPA: XdhC family protein [Pyrinomonadaceae bacterium]|nr:XdhC family protein [Pyrinomonadaceae bacterium]